MVQPAERDQRADRARFQAELGHSVAHVLEEQARMGGLTSEEPQDRRSAITKAANFDQRQRVCEEIREVPQRHASRATRLPIHHAEIASAMAPASIGVEATTRACRSRSRASAAGSVLVAIATSCNHRATRST